MRDYQEGKNSVFSEIDIENTGEDRLLFQSRLEDSVLGQVLINKESIYEVGGEFLECLFHSKKNKPVAKAIIQLFHDNQNIDILTVINKIRQNRDLEKSGGLARISKLTSNIGSTENLPLHIRVLQQYHLARYITAVCEQARAKIIDGREDTFDVLHEITSNLENSLKDIVKNKVSSVSDVNKELIDKHILYSGTGELSGVPTGLALVDNITNGWQKTDLVILAGRPAMGKTAVAISMVLAPTIEKNIPVAIFSLEMSKEQIVGRMQSALSGLDVSRIVKMQLNGREIIHLGESCKPLDSAPIYVDDTAGLSLSEFRVKARQLVREHGVKLILIDYLQLMSSGLKHNNRENEISAISRGLKIVAKDLQIPIIALSQLSRAVETRGGDKKPVLSDLRESGQIEQDADMIMFCYRPEYYGMNEYEINGDVHPTHGLFLLLIAKHRNGSLGDVPLRFIHENAHIKNHSDFMPKPKKTENIINQIQNKMITPNNDFDSVVEKETPFQIVNEDDSDDLFQRTDEDEEDMF